MKPSLTTLFMGLGIFAGALFLAGMKKGTTSGPLGTKVLGDGIRKGMRFEATTQNDFPNSLGVRLPGATQIFMAIADPQSLEVASSVNVIPAKAEGVAAIPADFLFQVPTTAVTRIL